MSESIYKTRQRELIVTCLKNNSASSLTAEEISDRLKAEGFSVGKATISRHLDTLVANGSVRKFVAQRGASASYQYTSHNSDCAHHFHLKCLGCGTLVHMGCDFMQNIDRHILEHHGFAVDNSKTVLYGLCKNCSGKDNRHA